MRLFFRSKIEDQSRDQQEDEEMMICRREEKKERKEPRTTREVPEVIYRWTSEKFSFSSDGGWWLVVVGVVSYVYSR